MMKMLRTKSGREQAWKHFYGTSEFLMTMAVFAVCAGIFLIAVFGSGLFGKEGQLDSCDMLVLVIGCIYVGLGGWGILFSRQKKGDFPKNAVVVFEMEFGTDRVLGSMLGIASFWVLLIFFEGTSAFWPSLGWGIVAGVICFLEFWLFYCSRNRRIVLLEDSVEYVDGFGRVRCWNNREIGQMVFHPVTERYTVLSREGEKLFTFKQSLLHASALFNRFPVAQMAVVRAEEKELFEQRFSVELGNKLRRAGWLLFAGDLLLRLFAAVLYFYTDLLGVWEFYVLMGVISLDLFVFSWAFGDALWEDWTYGEIKGEKWKGIHKDIILRQTVVLIVSIFTVREKAERMLECVHGGEALFFAGLLLFAVLLLPSVARFRGEKLYARLREMRLFQLVLLMAYTCFVTVILISGIWETGCSTSYHSMAQATKTGVSHSSRGGSTYYAWVILKDRSEERLEISRSIYYKMEEQEEVELCERTGWFGTEFAAVHVLGQCPFKEGSK